MTITQLAKIKEVQDAPDFKQWVGVWGNGRSLFLGSNAGLPFPLDKYRPVSRTKKTTTLIWYTKDGKIHYSQMEPNGTIVVEE